MFRLILATLGALFGLLAWFGTPELNPRIAEAPPRETAPAAVAAVAPVVMPAAMVQAVRMQVTPVQAAPQQAAPQQAGPQQIAPEQTAPARPRFPGPPLEPSPQYADAPAADAAPDAAPGEGTLTVSGDRVNLRAGPGTGHAVTGSVTRGAAVTAVGPTTGPWVEVRDASGLQGFIAAQFLSPGRAD